MNQSKLKTTIYHQPANQYLNYIATRVRSCIVTDLKNPNNEEAWRTYGMVTLDLSKVPASLESEFNTLINGHTTD